MSDGKTICVYPWTLLSVGSMGNLRPCCNAINARIEETPDVTAMITTKKDYTTDSLLNNYTHQELRKGMIAGERSPICTRCWKMEDSGMQSFREMINQRFADTYDYICETNTPDPVGIQRIEFDLGRKCNLRCRMCAPWSSSLISKEIYTHKESKQYYGEFGEPDDWVDVVDMQELLKPHLDTVREIYLIGGEPLIIDAHETLLDYLVDCGVSSRITLIYNTNGITLRPKFISQWKKFKHVQLNVSIDGIYEYYEYVRNPAKWETIEKNFDLLLTQTENTDTIECGISSTLQNLTVPAVLPLLRWADSKNLRVQMHTVDFPVFLQPDVMPEKEYDEFLLEMQKELPNIGINTWALQETISFLAGNRKNLTNIHLQKQFVSKQLLLDKIRNQNLFETHPWAKNI
jgi:sulfatase maturation enzyme AslB (radical SAM superfamily)